MKLIVKEINRKTEKIEAIWKHNFENMERCLKFIQRLDGDLIKNVLNLSGLLGRMTNYGI